MNARIEAALADIQAELPAEITPDVAMAAVRAAYMRGYLEALGGDDEEASA